MDPYERQLMADQETGLRMGRPTHKPPKPYVPDPDFGLVFQEAIGTRFIVIALERRGRRIGAVEIDPADKLGTVHWFDRTDWVRGFGLSGWLAL